MGGALGRNRAGRDVAVEFTSGLKSGLKKVSLSLGTTNFGHGLEQRG